VETRTGFAGHRLCREGQLWVLQADLTGSWEDLYAFTLEPQHPVDFEMANHFTSTYPRSPFVLNLTAQRTGPKRRTILRNRELVVHEGGTPSTLAIRDPEHLLQVLAEYFGLWFPVGTRFSRPEF
jgi:N-hydroxyarylamine O-acetyltransferase